MPTSAVGKAGTRAAWMGATTAEPASDSVDAVALSGSSSVQAGCAAAPPATANSSAPNSRAVAALLFIAAEGSLFVAKGAQRPCGRISQLPPRAAGGAFRRSCTIACTMEERRNARE